VIKVPKSPGLAQSGSYSDIQGVSGYLNSLYNGLMQAFSEHANSINNWATDEFAQADLPDPAKSKGRLVLVPDAAGGSIVAFSDGTDWLRLDRSAL